MDRENEKKKSRKHRHIAQKVKPLSPQFQADFYVSSPSLKFKNDKDKSHNKNKCVDCHQKVTDEKNIKEKLVLTETLSVIFISFCICSTMAIAKLVRHFKSKVRSQNM